MNKDEKIERLEEKIEWLIDNYAKDLHIKHINTRLYNSVEES